MIRMNKKSVGNEMFESKFMRGGERKEWRARLRWLEDAEIDLQ
jgi:hypothetical protein